MKRTTRIRLHKLGWFIYSLFVTTVGLKGIYALGQFLSLWAEFTLYTLLMFGVLICLYFRHLKSSAFWIGWFSLLAFLQLGVGRILFFEYWPESSSVLRTDLSTMVTCWLIFSLTELGYALVISCVLHLEPDMVKVHQRRQAWIKLAYARLSRPTVPALPDVPVLTFQLVHRALYRCPACKAEVPREDLRFGQPFECKNCHVRLELRRKVAEALTPVYLIIGLLIAKIAGVQSTVALLGWGVYLALTIGYTLSIFLPPTLEIHTDFHGVEPRLISSADGYRSLRIDR